ncbi:DUF4411 family protein [Corynebacterium pseudodiphtheriticum]|uniref:DUF4411 family protein n=1 Tax=Corynebacterium pseudodiphtheriticum TaxID=37637 RepID=UPI002551489A|nr:DUF4411 family protein [Corynebacterium pseudodiphtheriticum]MDK8477896.1 DUF4411 family protein [Corynebacterium pseudodiphtheriticum]MDK8550903.1 DUF4411 family protein [Corynebacterium pseudodiphtheriticum]MDK8562807.1 DUF4411 family protein [Corynebacterium pseudodiphtheriticum]
MYLVDTNILLNAFNYYPRSVFPSYWKVFEARLSSGEFCVHEQVYEELKKKDDDKIRWLEATVPKDRLLTKDSAELGLYAEVTQWVRFERNPAYQTKAVRDFLNHADSWLVASAAARRLTLLTNETASPQKINRVKIPDAAAAFGVSCYTNLEFLKSENIQF